MAKAKSEMTFETAMRRLEEIVKALENSSISLEDSLNLYKEGAQCSRFCRQKLEAAKHELEIWQQESAVAADISDLDGDAL